MVLFGIVICMHICYVSLGVDGYKPSKKNVSNRFFLQLREKSQTEKEHGSNLFV